MVTGSSFVSPKGCATDAGAVQNSITAIPRGPLCSARRDCAPAAAVKKIIALATTALWRILLNASNFLGSFNMLQAADKAPDFSLQDESGATRKLSEFRGRD